MSVAVKNSLVADDTATFWRGHNIFMSDFGYIMTHAKVIQTILLWSPTMGIYVQRLRMDTSRFMALYKCSSSSYYYYYLQRKGVVTSICIA